MLNKYIIDAKKDVLDLFDIGLEDFNYRELQMYNSYIKHLQYIGETNF